MWVFHSISFSTWLPNQSDRDFSQKINSRCSWWKFCLYLPILTIILYAWKVSMPVYFLHFKNFQNIQIIVFLFAYLRESKALATTGRLSIANVKGLSDGWLFYSVNGRNKNHLRRLFICIDKSVERMSKYLKPSTWNINIFFGKRQVKERFIAQFTIGTRCRSPLIVLTSTSHVMKFASESPYIAHHTSRRAPPN